MWQPYCIPTYYPAVDQVTPAMVTSHIDSTVQPISKKQRESFKPSIDSII